MNYENFMIYGAQYIVGGIEKDPKDEDIKKSIHAYVGGFLSDKLDRNSIYKNPLSEAKSGLEKMVKKLLMKNLTPSHIDEVMGYHGESLVDLGAEYDKEFYEWFKNKEPKIFEKWYEDSKEYIKDDPFGPAHLLLFEFSNDALDGAVKDKHDDYVAEFCNLNYDANMHIQSLYKDMIEAKENN